VELFLVLAAVIVAAASLFLAHSFRRMFNAYGERLSTTEQNTARLHKEGLERDDSARAELRALRQDIQQLRDVVDEIAQRHEAYSQTVDGKYQDAQKAISDVTKTVNQLRADVTSSLREQAARLGWLSQLTSDHGTRLNSLDQLAAEHKSRLASLDEGPASVIRLLADLRADAARLRAEAAEQAAALRDAGDDVTSASKRTAETLTGLGEQWLALAADVAQADLDRRELRTLLRKWFGYSAQPTVTTPLARVMPGFVHAERLAAAQLLPCLYESFLRSADLDFVFREQAGSAGVFYYLVARSPDRQPAEQQLGGLLSACPDADTALPGLAELRSLLLAMYAGGPGMIRLGPLVVSHAAGDMFSGIVLTAREAQALDTGDSLPSHMRCARLVSQLTGDRKLNLAPWAAANS
jgi:hypothetical protein